MESNFWWTIRDQSLAKYMRDAGFDLSVYELYSDAVRTEARKRAIKEAMAGIKEAFENEAGFPLADLERGVYVISLSAPLAIKYDKRWSRRMTPHAAGLVRSALVRMRNWPTISALLSRSPVFTARATASYGRGFGSPAFAPAPGECGG